MFGPLSEKYAEYAVVIGDSGRHLLAIINDILDLARADADRLVVAEEEVEIGRVVDLSSRIVQELAFKAEVDFVIETEDLLPNVLGDAAKLTQILVNLLSNAIKFTPAGGKVFLKIARHPQSGLIFRVADTGIGMSAEQIPIALSPFGQVDSGLNRKYDGVGLGLPLTKRLIELHEGTIEIASEPGRGTTVDFHLPQERVCSGGSQGSRATSLPVRREENQGCGLA